MKELSCVSIIGFGKAWYSLLECGISHLPWLRELNFVHSSHAQVHEFDIICTSLGEQI
jgi:hypothetical protein